MTTRWTVRGAQRQTTPARGAEAERHPHLVIRVGTAPYAFRLPSVLEILQVEGLAPLAGAPPALCGLMSLRGERLPILDLPRAVCGEPWSQSPEACVLVVEGRVDGRPARLGLAVDGVSRIHDWTSAEISPVPRLNAPFAIELIDGLAHVGAAFVPIFDLERVLASPELSAAVAASRPVAPVVGADPGDAHAREAPAVDPAHGGPQP